MAHKLLLADDSVTIQRVIELTFADEDVDVTTVGDGQMAIDRLDVDPPDIILADVDMPKRDGYEVAAYVKSRPKLAHIPVVLLTGAFEPIDLARATAAGSSDVLAKPFEPQMVINRVKELLGRKRHDDVREEVPAPPREAAREPAREPVPQKPQPPIEPPTPAGRQPSADAAQPVSLDDYFDQLDAAFSNLQPGT
ncbi:MAG: response regulator [Acidobacteria bacterium]|nr:MAG: response regulator [Acidobacteriota bacterium]